MLCDRKKQHDVVDSSEERFDEGHKQRLNHQQDVSGMND